MAEIRVKSTGTIKLFENDNTSNVTIASPASLGADRTVTLPDANVTLASGTMLATDGSGASLTALNASELGSGTVPTARLGSGTASSSTVLYGDQTYKAEPGGGKILQVVQTTSASSTLHNTITTYTASAISGAITPTAASSKIFISIFYASSLYHGPTTLAGGSVKLYRDIEAAGYAALFPTSIGSAQFRTIQVTSGTLGMRGAQALTYLDSPTYTLTDVITYKIYGAAGPSGYGNITTSPDSDSASVTLMEVAA